MVSIKEGKERSLSTGCALDTPEPEVVSRPLEVSQIPQQFLDPQGRSLSNCRQLSRLEVGESKRGQVAVLLGESRQA